MADNKKLTVGSAAPFFTLPDQDGTEFSLETVIGKKNLVLYFYPKDGSYGCTREACSFRDSYEVFLEAGAEVIGVSADSVDSHREFTAHNRLPFTLLSDRGRQVARLYGVPQTLGFISGRVTFIIDKKGIIRGIYNSQIHYGQHIEESLSVLRSLEKE